MISQTDRSQELLSAPASAPSQGATVLAVGFSDVWLEDLRQALRAEPETAGRKPLADRLEAGSDEQARNRLRRGDVAVLLLGPGLDVDISRELVTGTLGVTAAEATQSLVLGASGQALSFQELVALDRIFFLTASPPPIADVAAMVISAEYRYVASLGRQAMHAERQTEAPLDVSTAAQILELATSLARESDIVMVSRQATRQAALLTSASRAACWIYEQSSETLWTPASGLGDGELRESAAAGLVSFTLRTGRATCVPLIGEDPRFDADIDAFGAEDAEDHRLLAVPVVGNLEHGTPQTLAVLVALRRGADPEFVDDDAKRLAFLADHLAPVIGRLVLHEELRSAANRQTGMNDQDGLFRADAMNHYHRGLSDHGRVLELSPSWMHQTYRVLILLLVVALAWSWWGTIDEYAEGVGLVRVEGRHDVTAAVAGTVAAVEVETGDRVRAGQLLVRLYGAQEVADLKRIRREFELGLLNRLRYPADPLAARTLSALRLQQEVAESRLNERSVRADSAGMVSDLRVRRGQLLSPGDVVLSLEGEQSELRVLSVIPGHYRPLIEVGMPLRLELNGYRYAYQQLRVDSVSDEVFAPAEARRILGPGIGDPAALSGPVVVVESRLQDATFESDGRVYAFHDGVLGRAEVKVRSERILVTLIPALRRVFD